MSKIDVSVDMNTCVMSAWRIWYHVIIAYIRNDRSKVYVISDHRAIQGRKVIKIKSITPTEPKNKNKNKIKIYKDMPKRGR